MGYYLEINSLEGCSYSQEVNSLVKNHNINANINIISQNEKHLYKNQQINTFPQVYLKKYNSAGSILLGGNSDFKEILSMNNKTLDLQLKLLSDKYNSISKKTKLRIIELFLK